MLKATTSDKGSEATKDLLLNAVRDLAKKIDNNLSLYGKLAKDYKREHLEIHLHIKILDKSVATVSDYLCLVFKWPADCDIERNKFDVISRGQRKTLFSTAQPQTLHSKRKMQHPMLVDIRQFLQCPERFNGTIWPAVIRLQRINDCLRGWRDAPDFVFTLAQIFGAVDKNREFRTRDNINRDTASRMVCRDQGIGKMIERGSEIVKTVSDQNGQLNWKRSMKFDLDDVLSRIRVEFLDDTVRIAGTWTVKNHGLVSIPVPTRDLRLQGLQVLLRSI